METAAKQLEDMQLEDNGELERRLAHPPVARTSSGEIRRVGVEIEFGNLDPAEILTTIQSLWGGKIVQRGMHKGQVENTRFGTVTVAFDSSFLTERRYRRFLSDYGIELSGSVDSVIEKVLHVGLQLVVPYEIVMPPIPYYELTEIEPLRDRLYAAGAEGTKGSILNAFGLHLNIEVAVLEVPSILQVLRAFLDLRLQGERFYEVDVSRAATNFIKPFPDEYRRIVLDPSYCPDSRSFCLDYLSYNPTRDRPLDLLPIIASMTSKEFVQQRCEEPHLVSARPAYHYRLPDSRVDERGWRVLDEWNRWVSIERYAAEKYSGYAEEKRDARK